MPTITQPAAANFRVIQIADSGFPKVAAFAQGGITYATASFTTSYSGTGQNVIAGLTAGTYTVTVGGSPVAGSPFIVNAGDNTLYFESTSGIVAIAQVGAPSAPGGTLSCDLNGDGVVNVLDVQIASSATQGLIPCVAKYQLDGSGACTVIDVQRVAAASLGGSCKIGP